MHIASSRTRTGSLWFPSASRQPLSYAPLSIKYSQNLVDSAKKYATDAIKTASKRAIPKTVEATGDLISNKVANKITNSSKKSSKELPSTKLHSDEANNQIPKEKYISPQERQQIIDELRLI